MATLADASGTRTFAYNADGAPDSITYDTGPLAGYSLDYAQDALGRPFGYILADGTGTVAEAVYSYDAAGRLATVAPSSAPQAPSFTYGYTAGLPHRIATVTANNGTANVLTTTKTHDPLDRLLSISAAPSSALQAPSSAHTYAYNARNQRTRATLADAKTTCPHSGPLALWPHDFFGTGYFACICRRGQYINDVIPVAA